jgi:hypothetical protein
MGVGNRGQMAAPSLPAVQRMVEPIAARGSGIGRLMGVESGWCICAQRTAQMTNDLRRLCANDLSLYFFFC